MKKQIVYYKGFEFECELIRRDYEYYVYTGHCNHRKAYSKVVRIEGNWAIENYVLNNYFQIRENGTLKMIKVDDYLSQKVTRRRS